MVLLLWSSYARVGGDEAKGCPATGDLGFGPILHGEDVRMGVVNTNPLLEQILFPPVLPEGGLLSCVPQLAAVPGGVMLMFPRWGIHQRWVVGKEESGSCGGVGNGHLDAAEILGRESG